MTQLVSNTEETNIMSMDFGHLGKNKGLIVLILLRRPLVVINGLDEIHLSQGYSRSLSQIDA